MEDERVEKELAEEYLQNNNNNLQQKPNGYDTENKNKRR